MTLRKDLVVELDLPPAMEQMSGKTPEPWDVSWRQRFEGGEWPTGLGVSVDVPAPGMEPKTLDEAIDRDCVRMFSAKVLSKTEEGGEFRFVCHDPSGAQRLMLFRWLPLPGGSRLQCNASMLGFDQVGSVEAVTPRLERICRSVKITAAP